MWKFLNWLKIKFDSICNRKWAYRKTNWDTERGSFFNDTFQVNTSSSGTQSVSLKELILNGVDGVNLKECYESAKREVAHINTHSEKFLLDQIALKKQEQTIFVNMVNDIWETITQSYNGENVVKVQIPMQVTEEATCQLMDKIQVHYEDLGFDVHQLCLETMPPQFMMEFS